LSACSPNREEEARAHRATSATKIGTGFEKGKEQVRRENIMKRFLWLAPVLGVVALTACNGSSTNGTVTKEDVRRETREALEAARNYTQQEKEEYQVKAAGFILPLSAVP
jgi:hypothetical protein